MATWRSWIQSAGCRSALLALAAVGGDDRTGTALPRNLDVDPALRTFVAAMWQASPAFRGQCRRLAAAPDMFVSVLPEDRQHRPAAAKARTVVRLMNGRPVSARVHLAPSIGAPELIAHELEHILEQLDQVDLAAHAGKGAVWRSRDGSFETQRAIDAGQRVARELSGRADADAARPRPSADVVERIAAVALREHAAAPWSVGAARVSGDGRQVVFISTVRLVEGDRNDLRDAYVLDVRTGAVTLESGGAGGDSGNGETWTADISRDGRFVVFASDSGNLSGLRRPPGSPQIFVRDRDRGTTSLLTTDPQGAPANGPSRNPVISADGARVAFESTATDLVPHGGATGDAGIYLVEWRTGVRLRVDVSSAGDPRPRGSMTPSISADGRVVVFASRADLVGRARLPAAQPAASETTDVYVRDTLANTTRLLSRGLSGAEADGPSYHPAISGDGRYVAFVSQASNLTRRKTPGTALVHVHDRQSGDMIVVSAAGGAVLPDGPSVRPALSYDGSRVAFLSLAANLICERRCEQWQRDVNLQWDVFVHDRALGRSIRVSVDHTEWMEASGAPSLDHTGRVLAFGSRHPHDGDDVGRDLDLFVMGLAPEVTRIPDR